MAETKIEWCDRVLNPVTGCSPVSAGCEHYYAARMSKRLAGRCGYPADDPFRVTLHPEKLDLPLKWRKPQKIFVNSMSDLFHEDVPDEFISKVWDSMWAAKQHTFLILTKRPERMKKWVQENAYAKQFGWVEEQRIPFEPGDLIHIDDLWMRNMCGWVSQKCECDGGYVCDYPADKYSERCKHGNRICRSDNCPIGCDNPPREILEANGLEGQYEIDADGYSVECEWMELHTRPRNAFAQNVWLGVTVENQDQDWRIKYLLETMAAVRFVSVEPMLGALNVKKYLYPKHQVEGTLFDAPISISGYDLAKLAGLNGLDWVICGPETGPGKRPMKSEWIRDLYRQCEDAEVPFFDKKNILGLNLKQFPEVSK